jgi:hypothetical protein
MRHRHRLAGAYACVIAMTAAVLAIGPGALGAGAVNARAEPAIELSATLATAGDTVELRRRR